MYEEPPKSPLLSEGKLGFFCDSESGLSNNSLSSVDAQSALDSQSLSDFDFDKLPKPDTTTPLRLLHKSRQGIRLSPAEEKTLAEEQRRLLIWNSRTEKRFGSDILSSCIKNRIQINTKLDDDVLFLKNFKARRILIQLGINSNNAKQILAAFEDPDSDFDLDLDYKMTEALLSDAVKYVKEDNKHLLSMAIEKILTQYSVEIKDVIDKPNHLTFTSDLNLILVTQLMNINPNHLHELTQIYRILREINPHFVELYNQSHPCRLMLNRFLSNFEHQFILHLIYTVSNDVDYIENTFEALKSSFLRNSIGASKYLKSKYNEEPLIPIIALMEEMAKTLQPQEVAEESNESRLSYTI